MIAKEIQAIAEKLTSQFGLTFVASEGSNEIGPFVDLRPVDIEPAEGFKLRVQVGWRSVEVAFVLDAYSAQLLKAMNRAEPARREVFGHMAAEAMRSGVSVRLLINNSEQPLADPSTWPSSWNSFSLSLKRSPIDVSDSLTRIREMETWAKTSLALIMPFLPLDDDLAPAEADAELAGVPEGGRTRVEVNRYERSRLNRAICIQVKGTRCTVCGTDMGDVYGEIGQDYIHVHHLMPLASMGTDYRVDPVRDLVPICPNCHAMAHRRTPPISPDELSRMLRGRASHIT